MSFRTHALLSFIFHPFFFLGVLFWYLVLAVELVSH